jgi:competence protein ComEC
MTTTSQYSKLLVNKKQWYIFFTIILFIFALNISIQYNKYLTLKSLEIQNIVIKVINIYKKKDNYYILKLKNKDILFYTKLLNNTQNIKNEDLINIDIITTKINFIDYLKGFYAKSFNIFKLESKVSSFKDISNFITNQHSNDDIKELFNALFLATPINKSLRDKCVDFGVSHLIALSGFHLGVLSLIIFYIFYYPYQYIHQNYFPYRNIKFDLLILTSIILMFYLIFLDLVPSLLRAFSMYIFAIFLYRNNIKILSFTTLVLTLFLLIAFIPKLLFSISLWLSIAGVFYIFLFLKYFININKVLLFLLFNVWIFLAISPIVHQLFPIGSIHQFYSPLFTIGFSIFYPVELFLHIINYGYLLDNIINIWLNIPSKVYQTYTTMYFTAFYILISLLSIYKKIFFYILNILIVCFILFNYM